MRCEIFWDAIATLHLSELEQNYEVALLCLILSCLKIALSEVDIVSGRRIKQSVYECWMRLPYVENGIVLVGFFSFAFKWAS